MKRVYDRPKQWPLSAAYGRLRHNVMRKGGAFLNVCGAIELLFEELGSQVVGKQMIKTTMTTQAVLTGRHQLLTWETSSIHRCEVNIFNAVASFQMNADQGTGVPSAD